MSRSSANDSDAVQRLNERATAIRDRELETALRKLESKGDLSAAQRAEIIALAERIVRGIITPLETAIETAPEEQSAEILCELFVEDGCSDSDSGSPVRSPGGRRDGD